MGNHHSHTPPPQSVDVVRRPPSRPNAPPSSRPLSELGPKGPTYYSPENLVLPKDIPLNRKLRPVSLELSKFRPEYSDIFMYDEETKKALGLEDEEHEENNENDEKMLTNDNKENVKEDMETGTFQFTGKDLKGIPDAPPPPMQNGHIPGSTTFPQNNSSSVGEQKPQVNGILKNSNSGATHLKINMVNPNPNPVQQKPGHRRQMSAGASLSLTNQANIIYEEPEENIDDRAKIDPLYQSLPPGTSLPVKNNFDMDYSYQLTYVQLAEHRRKKTIEELEKKTGKKLSDLSADLEQNVDRPSFNRDSAARASSRSSASSDTGVSKRKKRAPPPPSPGTPRTAPSSPRSASNTPRTAPAELHSQPYSFENEPPIDYDEPESPRRNLPSSPRSVGVVAPQGFHSNKKPSSVPPPKPPPPPALLTKQTPRKSTSGPKEFASKLPEIQLKRTPSVKETMSSSATPSSNIPWLLEMKNVAESRAVLRQISQESGSSGQTPPVQDPKPETPIAEPQPNLIFTSENLKSVAGNKTVTPTTDAATKSSEEKEQETSSSPQNEFRIPPLKPVQRQQSFKEVYTSKPLETTTNLQRHHSTTQFDRHTSPVLQRQTSAPEEHGTGSIPRQQSSPALSSTSGTDPVRRLNSLLQHDIKLAAQAKVVKLQKTTTPVPPKPKDPHEVFREHLAKACAARDKRVEAEGTIDEKLKLERKESETKETFEIKKEMDTVFKTDVVKVKKKDSKRGKREDSLESENSGKDRQKQESFKSGPAVAPKHRYNKNAASRNTNAGNYGRPRQRAPSVSDEESQSVSPAESPYMARTEAWAPEDDLESDDDLSDREVMTARKGGTNEGFKSNIIPNKVDDLKSKKKGKDKKGAKKQADYSSDEQHKNKYGSIKKFRKSVHKSVLNAFGSISRASGKVLKKQRAEDLETVEDAPKNWRFSKSEPVAGGLNFDRSQKYVVPNGIHDDSDVSDDEHGFSPRLRPMEADAKFFMANGDLRQNGFGTHEDHSDHDEDSPQTPKTMKRAGVAYVSAKGQIVVLPDYETVEVDEDGLPVQKNGEGRAPKLYEKKKKFTYDATVRKKEREKQEEVAAEHVREKEKQMEEERRKQLEMELEFHKIREMETRERLQRLEAAHLQHQINTQLQQQQSMMMTAPPLPPPGNYIGNGNVPEMGQAQTPGFTNLFVGSHLPPPGLQPNYGLTFNPQGQLNGPILNGNLPSMPMDVNEYMRVLNLQAPPPPTGQNYAYMLNSVNWNPSAMDKQTTVTTLLNPEQMKSYSGRTFDYPQIEGSKSQSYPMLNGDVNSTEVLNGENSLNNFVSQYQYGASGEKRRSETEAKPRKNPLYNSSDSESEELSPLRTVVTAQVQDHRTIPPYSQAAFTNAPNLNEQVTITSSPSMITKFHGPAGYRTVVQFGTEPGSQDKS